MRNNLLSDMPEDVRLEPIIRDFVLGDRRMDERHDLKISSGLAALPPGHEPLLWGALLPPRPSFRLSFPGDTKNTYGFVELSADEGFTRHEVLALKVLAVLIGGFERAIDGRRTLSLIPSVGNALRQVRLSLRISECDLATELSIQSTVLARWEDGFDSPERRATIYDWCHALGLVCPPKTALVRVVEFSPELFRLLRENPERLRALTPGQFERFIAERLDRMGYNVMLTGATNRKDGGIDLIAVPKAASLGSVVIAGQVKHHRGDQKTGRDAVDRLLAWKDSYFGIGLLITNTKFTNDAVWTAQRERNARFLRLRDFIDLKRWIEGQFGSEQDWREIPDRIELAPGVVIEIPRPRINSQFSDVVDGDD